MNEKRKTAIWERIGGYLHINRDSTSGLNEVKKLDEEPMGELWVPKTNLDLANEALRKMPDNLSKEDFNKETEKIRKKYPV